MNNLAYQPTTIQKKVYTARAIKLAKVLRELGYTWDEIEEEVIIKAVNKYLRSLTCDENTFLNFKDGLELKMKIEKLSYAE